MNILQLLKGKRMKVMTEVGVEVEVTIKEVKENHHSQELEPATPQNDWWPATRDWTTYTVYFTTGKSKTFSSLNELQIID